MYLQINEKFGVKQAPKCARTKRRKSCFFFFFLEDHGARELPVSIKVILLPRDCPCGAQQADAFSSPCSRTAPCSCSWSLVPAPGLWSLLLVPAPGPAPGPCSWSCSWCLHSEPPAAAALPSAFGSKVLRRAGGAGPRVEVGVEVEGSETGADRQTDR